MWYWYEHLWNKEKHLATAGYQTCYPDQPARSLITVLTMLPHRHITVIKFHPNGAAKHFQNAHNE